MTDRVDGFVVTLKKDMRIDDAESLMDAIKLMYNVASVSPHISDFETRMAREQVKRELTKKLWEALE